MTFWLLLQNLMFYHLATGDSLELYKATALGSCDKHPAHCHDWNVDLCYTCAMIRGTRQ